MEKLLAYFDTISSLHRALILTGGIVFFWMIEGLIPLFRFKYKKFSHAGINIFFTLTTVIVNFALAFMLVGASDWVTANGWGVYQWMGGPLWLKVLTGLMLLDLVGAYLVHLIQHKIRPLWRFHLVHHTDAFVDTTSANRHHPGESLMRAVFTALAILVSGAPAAVVMLYQSASALLAQFNHANIVVPQWLDRPLSWLIVSPNMHKVHHHFTQPLTDTNYGNIFSVWDRLFGTYAYVADPKSLVYGIDTHMKPEEHSQIGNLLKIPFQPYRPPVGAKFSVQQEKTVS